MNNKQQYVVYILQCVDGKYYTGSTTSLEDRINEHNLGVDPFAFTTTRRPVKLVWSETFKTQLEASAVER